MRRFILIVTLAALCVTANASIKPNALFTDGVVMQRGMPAPVWGTASDGEKVTVALQGQTVSTVAKGGKWMVKLKPLTAGGPLTMTISGENTIEVKNVLVGEVWVCAGQSNMGFGLERAANGPEAVASSKDANMRLLSVKYTSVETPATDVNGAWVECGTETSGNFTAVGYFFGRDLRKALNVPIGLIDTSVGGTGVQAWMSKATLEGDPVAAATIKSPLTWVKADRKPYVLYNGMVAPLQPFAIRGVIWYQGESNVRAAKAYRTIFPLMIGNWRKDWGQGDFPFLFVQLPGFHMKVTEPQESNWAETREVQLVTSQTCPKTAMAVMADTGEEKNIHPIVKEPAGVRLALAARAVAYGEKIVYQGPLYRSLRVSASSAILRFGSVGGGLVAKGGELKGFTICGADKKFANAQAEISGDTVVVTSPEVKEPVAVRYGWANFPLGNLFNKEDLPASPFRTDDLPLPTVIE